MHLNPLMKKKNSAYKWTQIHDVAFKDTVEKHEHKPVWFMLSYGNGLPQTPTQELGALTNTRAHLRKRQQLLFRCSETGMYAHAHRQTNIQAPLCAAHCSQPNSELWALWVKQSSVIPSASMIAGVCARNTATEGTHSSITSDI